MRRFIIIALAGALLGFAYPSDLSRAQGEVIEGPARVIDADMLAVGKTRMILWGLDAPERSQECRLNGKAWTCWNVAARELQILVANGPVRCENKGTADVFKRIYAICTANGININDAFVRSGMALALREQSEDYVAAEDDARQRNAGLWQADAEFVEPWEWRKTRASNGAR